MFILDRMGVNLLEFRINTCMSTEGLRHNFVIFFPGKLIGCMVFGKKKRYCN